MNSNSTRLLIALLILTAALPSWAVSRSKRLKYRPNKSTYMLLKESPLNMSVSAEIEESKDDDQDRNGWGGSLGTSFGYALGEYGSFGLNPVVYYTNTDDGGTDANFDEINYSYGLGGLMSQDVHGVACSMDMGYTQDISDGNQDASGEFWGGIYLSRSLIPGVSISGAFNADALARKHGNIGNEVGSYAVKGKLGWTMTKKLSFSFYLKYYDVSFIGDTSSQGVKFGPSFSYSIDQNVSTSIWTNYEPQTAVNDEALTTVDSWFSKATIGLSLYITVF